MSQDHLLVLGSPRKQPTFPSKLARPGSSSCHVGRCPLLIVTLLGASHPMNSETLTGQKQTILGRRCVAGVCSTRVAPGKNPVCVEWITGAGMADPTWERKRIRRLSLKETKTSPGPQSGRVTNPGADSGPLEIITSFCFSVEFSSTVASESYFCESTLGSSHTWDLKPCKSCLDNE